MDNISRTKEYFNKNISRLRYIKEVLQSDIAMATAVSLQKKMTGKVLDIASGGRGDYSLDDIDTLVSLDISSRSLMVERDRSSKVRFIVGDARDIGVQSNFFDSVVILHTIHHLAGNTVAETHDNVERCLRESCRALRRGGRFFIIEAVCAHLVQGAENVLFRLFFSILNSWGKPMVYYFSLRNLMNVLQKVGFGYVSFSRLGTGNARLCPFTSSIGIPFKYTPLYHVLVEGIKL